MTCAQSVNTGIQEFGGVDLRLGDEVREPESALSVASVLLALVLLTDTRCGLILLGLLP